MCLCSEEPPAETHASSTRYYVPKGAAGNAVTMAEGEDPKAQPYYFYFDVINGPDWAELEEYPEARGSLRSHAATTTITGAALTFICFLKAVLHR